jgi:Flp pilus assembly protein TadG
MRHIIRNPITRLFQNEDGVAAVEFAIVLPMLVLLAVCTMDIGGGFYRRMQVVSAAQAGTTYASIYGFNATSIAAAVSSATKGAVATTPAPRQFCGCPSISGVTEVACPSNCPTGVVAGTYVTSSAQAQYTPIFSYPSFPRVMTFQSTATVRIR